MAKIGILDDEVVICETLNKYLLELGYEVPDYAMTYDEGVKLIEDESPDLMLLDINIGGEKTGIDLATIIRKYHDIPLVFVSSYSDQATIESAKTIQPNGYLVKPFSKEDLFVAIEVALSNFMSKQNNTSTEERTVKPLSDALFIKQDSLFVKVKFNDIKFIRSEGVYVEIMTDSKKYLIRETMKNILDSLPAELFFQIHRSYIVHLQRIDAVNSEFVIIEKEPLPISRSLKDELMNRLNLL